MKEFALGCLPSPIDYRDYKADNFFAIKSSFPNEYMPKELIFAENQLNIGACVAFGIELQTAYHELAERGKLERFDQNYIYRNRSPDHHQGEGMVPREAYSMLIRYGVPPKGAGFSYKYPMPYSLLKNEPITPEMNSYAVFQRIESYFAVQFEEEIKTVLQHGPVGITIPVYDSFYDCPKDGMLKLPDTAKETLRGYHFVIIIGWRKDRRWVIQNSWGDLWGDRRMKGYCMAYMPFDYPVREKWGVIDEELPPVKKNEQTKIEMWIDKPVAKVNNKEVLIDPANALVTPKIIQNRTMVPVRFIAENFNANIDWNEKERKVVITK